MEGAPVINKQVPAEELADYIGKDAAEKLLAAPVEQMAVYDGVKDESAKVRTQLLEGLDLKVGGEGMKGFYDKILVDYANKFGQEIRREGC